MKKNILLALAMLVLITLFIFSKSKFQNEEIAAELLSNLNKVPQILPKDIVVEPPKNKSLPTLASATGNITTLIESKINTKSPLVEKMVELKQFISTLKIDQSSDPEGLKWNEGLSALDIKLQNFLDDPNFSRKEKITNLWNLVNQIEQGVPTSYLIEALTKLHPFEIYNQIIDTFQTAAVYGEETTIRQLELLSLLRAGVNAPKESLTVNKIEQFEQAVAQTKAWLGQQLYDNSNAAVFKESLSLYYDIVTLPEFIETFPKIATSVANDSSLKKDFYAIWAQSTFSRPELQPTIEILFNSPLPKSDISELNFEIYEVLKNLSSGNIIDGVRNELIDYLKKQEPLTTENAQDYLRWMNAYVAIQSPDEITKNTLLGHLVTNDRTGDALLQAYAVELWGKETIISTWEKADIISLVNNLQNALASQQLSEQDQQTIQRAFEQFKHANTP